MDVDADLILHLGDRQLQSRLAEIAPGQTTSETTSMVTRSIVIPYSAIPQAAVDSDRIAVLSDDFNEAEPRKSMTRL